PWSRLWSDGELRVGEDYHSLLASCYSPLARQCSILTPVSATTLCQRAVSAVISAVRSSGVPPMVDTPTSARRLRTSGSFTTELNAALSLATTAGGVLGGASTPDQLSATTSGKPSSAKVGTSGITSDRVCAATARIFALPALSCGISTGTSALIALICPPIRSAIAGPAPR